VEDVVPVWKVPRITDYRSKQTTETAGADCSCRLRDALNNPAVDRRKREVAWCSIAGLFRFNTSRAARIWLVVGRLAGSLNWGIKWRLLWPRTWIVFRTMSVYQSVPKMQLKSSMANAANFTVFVCLLWNGPPSPLWHEIFRPRPLATRATRKQGLRWPKVIISTLCGVRTNTEWSSQRKNAKRLIKKGKKTKSRQRKINTSHHRHNHHRLVLTYLFAKIEKITMAPMGKIKQFFKRS